MITSPNMEVYSKNGKRLSDLQVKMGGTMATDFTQTSASSSSVWPSERWTTITQQFKQNQKDIKRIEKILYKNDKVVPKKNKLLESSSKFNQF